MSRRPPSSAASGNRRRDVLPQGNVPARLILALAWLILFCVWFYSFGLPNNRPIERWQIWTVLPFDLLDLVDPPPPEPHAPAWSWLYLGQRLPFLGIACVLWTGAVSFGRLLLRLLRICNVFDRVERLFFAGCLGLAMLSLLMLGLGLIGSMSRGPLLTLIVSGGLLESWLTWRDCQQGECASDRESPGIHASRPTKPHYDAQATGAVERPTWLPWVVLAVTLPFVFGMFLGAMSPQTDFDVLEYHLGGPKEWYQQGQISRLPHNVYTSFPFLTEMLLLGGMVLFGDWEWGALAGQAVTAGFAPLTAIGLYATGRRWFSEAAGWLAVLVWLTTPWVYRISIIAYAEGGLACYLFAAFAVSLRLLWANDDTTQREQQFANIDHRSAGDGLPGSPGFPAKRESTMGPSKLDSSEACRSPACTARLTILCGLLAGSAMACKYTGLISVIIPIGILAAWSAARSSQSTSSARRVLFTVSLFGAGAFIAIGPWLLKNGLETGNPVFPLAYSIFGGEGRDSAMDAQWQRGHSSYYARPIDRLWDLPVKLTDVVANNDWHSMLMFGLAPVALLAGWRKKVWWLWAFVGWQYLTWFLFTHHIDRFYVPMFPVVALLAGCGASWLGGFAVGHWCGGGLIAASVLFNAWVMQNIGGFNAGRTDLRTAAELVVSPPQRWLNDEFASGRLPRDFKVLCVGEAALFHAHFPYVYNTVFDRSRFEEWFAERSDSGEFRLRAPDQIRETLRQQGITHVLVNWSEILRYREPGSYGYTDFAHPDWFAKLQAAGLLDGPMTLPDRVAFVPVTEARRKQVADWAPGLLTSLADRPAIRAVQVYAVRQ